MSLGSILGGIAGGVIGFFYGGPVGALYGASIGFGIGSYIDPITPDSSGIGIPNPEIQVMSAEVGDPVSDVLGTAKVTGHLLCYGGERSEAQYTEVEGGKGGDDPDPQLTGYRYYMSWAVGICSGPIDTIYAIYKNDDDAPVWSGSLDLPTSGGQETIAITGVGSVIFYFGTDDQVINSTVGSIISDSTLNTPYRNLCWAFFNDCYIGEYNRTPTYHFVIKKIPTQSFSTHDTIQDYDINPAHAMWYILHNLCGLPESWLDSDDFESVAYTLYRESRGISVLFSSQQSALGYLESINAHVDSIIRYGADAKFHPKLIRDDYVDSNLLEIDESVMLDDPSFSRSSWIDTVNELKVQYSELFNVSRDKTLSGSLYVSGENGTNYTIAGDTAPSAWSELTVVPDIEGWDVTNVIGIMGSTFLKKSDGTLWTRGDNASGKLGIGSGSSIVKEWSQVSVNFADVQTYYDQSFALTDGGAMYVCGKNTSGGLPVTPVSVRSFIQEEDNRIWTVFGAGYGAHRLGVSTAVFPASPYDETIAVSTFGGGGYNTEHQMGLPDYNGLMDGWSSLNFSGANIIEIRGGTVFTVIAVGTSGSFELYSAGRNTEGQCGVENFDTVTDWTLVTGGPWKNYAVAHANLSAVKTDGTLWACGDNYYHQLGQGETNSDINTMTQVGERTDFVKTCFSQKNLYGLTSEGAIYACGSNSNGECGTGTPSVTDIKVLTREHLEETWLNLFAFTGGMLAIK